MSAKSLAEDSDSGSIEVQREIVKVLDSFTELEAKLEAELQAELYQRHGNISTTATLANFR